ncbi:MAG: squalene/phytoene synthase family protein [Allosphingosinicella sp.]
MTVDLDPDRVLALSYVPGKSRAAVGALWRLDSALAAALTGGREPMISRIKLAWWREALERLDREPAPAEPVLEALAEHVLPAGVSGAELAAMEEGWAILASPETLTADELTAYARARGTLLFRFTAHLLGGSGMAQEAGEAWALVDLARHCGAVDDADVALAAARTRTLPKRWPVRLRPLGMLAVLAARDLDSARPPFETRGAPARMWRMLRHRISGY